LRFGAFSDGTGNLRLFAGQPASHAGAEVTTIFGASGGTVEAVVYRCYDGPAAEDTSFVVARGLLS
jgi:hypothetical protein